LQRKGPRRNSRIRRRSDLTSGNPENSMNKTLIACAVAAALAVAAPAAEAARGDGQSGARSGGNWSGSHGNWSGNRGNWSGSHGNWSGNRGNWSGHRGDWNGGRRWYGSHWNGYRHFGYGSVYLGWPWYWWGPSYYGYPAYTYYDYPSYYDSTEVYVEPSGSAPAPGPEQQSQYYCPDSGYYPSVQSCPRGWLRVLPGDAPPR
jgi:hypothetical protein